MTVPRSRIETVYWWADTLIDYYGFARTTAMQRGSSRGASAGRMTTGAPLSRAARRVVRGNVLALPAA